MFILTNEQRHCFALSTIKNTWVQRKLEPSRYDRHDTYLYLDGQNVKKVVMVCQQEDANARYIEYDVNETLSEDGEFLLPKTSQGKSVRLTPSSIDKRTRVGMVLLYVGDGLFLYNATAQQDYYNSYIAGVKFKGFRDFIVWLDDWCASTGEEELADIEEFAARKRTHVKFREGDFFRFRLTRGLWGFGRIQLDYDKMRRQKKPIYNVFMGKPVIASVYRFVSTNRNVGIDVLEQMPMLPSDSVMDNPFYYGEYEIIGNKPLTDREKDFPIYYGRPINWRESGLRFMCGTVYLESDCTQILHRNVAVGNGMPGIGGFLKVNLPLLQECIRTASNRPYWDAHSFDLRCPDRKKEKAEIFAQMKVNEKEIFIHSEE